MQRRQFLTGTAAAGVGGLAMAMTNMAPLARGEEPAGARQLLELRTYSFGSLDKQKAFDDFLGQAAIPALGRAGVRPVGVFKLMKADNPDLKLTEESTSLYVLLPHKSADSVLTLPGRLDADAEYQKAGQAVLAGPKSDPAYVRYESSLLLAFKGFTDVRVPSKAEGRIFQLRTYESHNEDKARLKLQMFNDGGELDIFKRCGMNGVYGQGLIGSKLPWLTYMLGFDDKNALDAGWAAFKKDPGWMKLQKDDTYKDTVSHITNLIVRPAGSSQI